MTRDATVPDLDTLWRIATDPDAPRVADPRVTGIAVAECGEQLVDAAEQLRVRPHHGQQPSLGPAGTLVRSGVLARLVEAAAALPGLRLALVEGYRPATRQTAEFDAERDRLAARHPDWSAARLRHEASAFVAPAEDSAPHACGGAVDVCVLDLAGDGLADLGTPVNGFRGRSGHACYTGYPDLPAAVRERRARLVSAMTGAGFVNYPTEWWHWSYGDRYWAWSTGAPTSPYGPCHRLAHTRPPMDDLSARQPWSTP